MSLKTLATVAVTVFLAEIGDKTQFATMLYAAQPDTSKWSVFLGASIALVAAAAIGVLAGSAITRVVGPGLLKVIAGVGFILVGIWTLAAR